MQDTKLVVARSYASRPEADLAKGALEDAGILAMIQADTAGGMREHLAWSGAGFKTLVREEDATAAREVLAPPTESAENPDEASLLVAVDGSRLRPAVTSSVFYLGNKSILCRVPQ